MQDDDFSDEVAAFALESAEGSDDVPYAPREFKSISNEDLMLANRDVLLKYALDCNARMEEFFQHFRNMHKKLDAAKGLNPGKRGPKVRSETVVR